MAIAALSACMLAGCGKDGPFGPEAGSTAETEAVVDPVKERMLDKEYVGKLEGQIDARKAIMREMVEARQNLARAERAGKTGEELVAFSNAVKAVEKKFELNRAQTVVLVSNQMRQQNGANVNKLQQKGK